MKTNTPYGSTYIWNLGWEGEEVKFTETESRKAVTRGWDGDGGQEKRVRVGGVGQKVYTFSYKVSKF